MKKILKLIFILALTLFAVSCNLLKDADEAGAGFGDVLVHQSGVTVSSSLSVTAGAINFDTADLSIDGSTGKLDETIANIGSGPQSLMIKVQSNSDDWYIGTQTILVTADKCAEISSLEISEELTPSGTYKQSSGEWKIVFSPLEFGITISNEIHLVGGFASQGGKDWDPEDKTFALEKQEDGSWSAEFELTEGTEFKFMYDATSWDDGNHLGSDGDSNGPNWTVEDKSSYGDAIVNQSGITVASSLGITTSDLDFSTGVVTINSKTADLGEAIEDLDAGNYDLTVKVKSTDGTKWYSKTTSITVVAGEETAFNVELDTETVIPTTNAYNFIFDPTAYGVTVTSEVHLVGDLSSHGGGNWDPADLSFPLIEQADGTWSAYYDLPDGVDFKFIYDSTTWNSHDIGNGSSNWSVGETAGVMEAGLVWQFTFDPSAYSVTVTSEVHLVGDLTADGGSNWDPSDTLFSLVEQDDSTWVGYFDITDGKGFKFIYDSTTWNSHDIGNGSSNWSVAETSGVITQTF